MNKNLSTLAVVVLALLMQLRVAYACEATGLWPTEPCGAHGLIVDGQPEAPQDRGEACDIALDLAGRGLRPGGEQGDLHAELSPPQPLFLPAAWPALAAVPALPRPEPPPRLGDRPGDDRAPASPGALTYLRTSRLRI